MITAFPRLILFISIYLTCSCFSPGQEKKEQMTSNAMDKTIGKKVSQVDKRIMAIFQDSQNHYWFGSGSKGVYKYDGDKITEFSTEDGLCSNSILGIQEDRFGNIYFDTPDHTTYFDNVAGVPERSKYRVRFHELIPRFV